MLEGLLEEVPPENKTSDLMEQFFVFALTWAFGGPMVVDKSDDYRRCRLQVPLVFHSCRPRSSWGSTV